MKRNNETLFRERRGKKILTSLAILLMALSSGVRAESTFNFHLTDADGKEIILPVDETLHFHIADNSLVLSSSGEEITLAVDNVKGLKYNPVSSVGEIPAADLPTVRLTDRSIVITSPVVGCADNSYRVYDQSGMEELHGSFGTETVIPLDSFGKGVHILCIENSPALKFLVK